jgi:hypothetical protein
MRENNSIQIKNILLEPKPKIKFLDLWSKIYVVKLKRFHRRIENVL